jgi:hypothetical protein
MKMPGHFQRERRLGAQGFCRRSIRAATTPLKWKFAPARVRMKVAAVADWLLGGDAVE